MPLRSLETTRFTSGSPHRQLTFLRLDRKPLLLPRAPSADERARLLPSCPPQLAHHPGARRFVQSRTVDSERRVQIETELPCCPHRIVGNKANRVAGAQRVVAVRAFGPCVDYDHRLVTLPERAQLEDR